MDIYVVLAGGGKKSVVIGVSARLQGAELIRTKYLTVNPFAVSWIENHELRDL